MVTVLDKNTALVLIDLQQSIVSLPLATPVDGVLNNCAKLLAAFREANLPIVIVNVDHTNAAWMNTRKEGNPPARPAPTPEMLAIVPAIETRPDDIFITKHTWGAFFETALEEELRKRNVTGIVLAGIATSIGVEGTARHASERGFNVCFATDAMTDLFPDAHQHSITRIFPRMGELDETDKIIALLKSR